MKKKDFEKLADKLPDSPGIYFFKKGKKVLYVGKATSLRDRVRSYFSSDLILTRGVRLVKMLEEANSIKTIPTNSVLEAILLEAHHIKKLQPIYNSREKDDKSYNYVVITDEDYPRVLIVRGRELLKTNNLKLKTTFGPFPHGGQLREALRIIRKIFPFRDKCTPLDLKLKAESYKLKAVKRGCFNFQIGLCPGVCTGKINKKEYVKTIKNLELFFSGNISAVKKNLEKEMKVLAKEKKFEEAGVLKQKIFALDHIRDVSLIKGDLISSTGTSETTGFRIEAYDIAHTAGSKTVGVMVVMEDGELSPSEYRKFAVRGKGEVNIDDTGSLREVLTRRLGHLEWSLPNLIVIDGGKGQLNTANQVLKKKGFSIDVVSVVKDERHKAKDILGTKSVVLKRKEEILKINHEAHRFAITYHRKLLRSRLGRNV